MLDGAFTSPKIRRLAVVLGVPWPHALGLAGLLWRFTAKHAPTGEIGRHDDEEIAAALEWPGEAADLVAALIRCRLLDPTESAARLLVHDWPEHAPRYVSATLKRQKSRFSAEYRRSTTVATTVPTTVATTVETTSSSTSTSTSSGSAGAAPRTIQEGGHTKQSARASVSIQSHEDAPQGVPRVSMDEDSSRPENAGERILRPLATSLEKLAENVWEAYLAGRKSGKRSALPIISKSIKARAKRDRCTPEESADRIRHAVEADVRTMIERIRTGETELKFCPMGLTYFRQERWNDDDHGPTDTDVREARIDDEIRRARAELG